MLEKKPMLNKRKNLRVNFDLVKVATSQTPLDIQYDSTGVKTMMNNSSLSKGKSNFPKISRARQSIDFLKKNSNNDIDNDSVENAYDKVTDPYI